MVPFSYFENSLPVPERLSTAYRKAWVNLAKTGNWWTAKERIAIAAESRNAFNCELCRQRKTALSPNTIEGEHNHLSLLPQPVIEATHRIITDQNRITSSYIEGLQNQSISHGHYVELLGITVMVFSIDEFHRGMGLALEPLPIPAPETDEQYPDNYRPTMAKIDDAFVPMLPADGAIGNESDLWVNDQTGNVIRALSLVPNAVRDLLLLSAAQYIPMKKIRAFGESIHRALSRVQVELVAGRVSALNQCFY